MKNIVIIDHEPFTNHRQSLFCVEKLQSKGVKIEWWDVSAIFIPTMPQNDQPKPEYLSVITDFNNLSAMLQKAQIQNNVFIVEVYENWKNRKFFHLLSKLNCTTVKIELYANTALMDISFWQKLKNTNPSNLICAFKNKVQKFRYNRYRKIHKIKGYDLYLSSGNNPDIDIHINHPDWEKFRSAKSYENSYKYAAFLDTYYPLHPDLFIFERNHNPKPKLYYSTMRNYFEHLQGVGVVVAEHPKANYTCKEFGENVQYIKYKTCQIVKGAEFVISHNSNSVAFAVMANKPIALIATKEMIGSRVYTQTKKVAQTLGLKVQIVDKCNKQPIVAQKVSDSVRDAYIYGYLTSKNAQNKQNVDIIFQALEEL